MVIINDNDNVPTNTNNDHDNYPSVVLSHLARAHVQDTLQNNLVEQNGTDSSVGRRGGSQMQAA